MLRHKKGIRASQYFALISLRTCENWPGSRMRAVPGNSGPVTLPRIVQGATVTLALFRIRLYFPNLLLVMKYNRPSDSANQTGVRTATPFFRNVARLTYFC